MRLLHHAREEITAIPRRHFRQLTEVVSAGESNSLWRVLLAFGTLQTVYMHTKGKGKNVKAYEVRFKRSHLTEYRI